MWEAVIVEARDAPQGSDRRGRNTARERSASPTKPKREKPSELPSERAPPTVASALDAALALAGSGSLAGGAGGAIGAGQVASEEASVLDQAMVDLEIQAWETLEEQVNAPSAAARSSPPSARESTSRSPFDEASRRRSRAGRTR